MLNGLRRVRPDEPFSVTADGWNTIVDAVNDWAQGRKDQPAPQGRMIGCVEALALNSTGAALREYKPAAVTAAGGYNLGNDEPAALWNRRPLLTLGAPSATTDWVCVTLEAIPAGAIGRVAISGVCLCDVDSASGATWAAPQAGSTAALLGGSTGTVRVLHVPSSGGSQRRCAVYLHERPAATTTDPRLRFVQLSGTLLLNQASGVWQDVVTTTTLPAANTLININLNSLFNTATVGDYLVARVVDGSGAAVFSDVTFSATQVAGVDQYSQIAASRTNTLSGGTYKLQCRRVFTGAVTSSLLLQGGTSLIFTPVSNY